MKKRTGKIRWGIISAANITSRVIPAIQKSRNAVLVALASKSEERLSLIGRKYNIRNLFRSYEEMLNPDPGGCRLYSSY